jgi:phytoene synthase
MAVGDAARPPAAALACQIAAAAKAFDYDRYLAALLSYESGREDLLTLLAFAAEVSAVPEKVSEPHLGRMRLQWWRDALQAPALERTGNPLADSMREVLTRRGIPAPLLLGYIDALEFHLERRPMPDVQHLKAYLVKTEAALFLGAARILGGEESALDAVCESAGLALGRARLVLGFARQVARGRLLLPVDDALLARLDDADLPDENVRQGIDRILRAEAEEARAEARRAVAGVGRLPARVRAAFLPVATVEGDMARWWRQRLDPLREVVRPSQLAHVWRIWRMHWRWGKAP